MRISHCHSVRQSQSDTVKWTHALVKPSSSNRGQKTRRGGDGRPRREGAFKGRVHSALHRWFYAARQGNVTTRPQFYNKMKFQRSNLFKHRQINSPCLWPLRLLGELKVVGATGSHTLLCRVNCCWATFVASTLVDATPGVGPQWVLKCDRGG